MFEYFPQYHKSFSNILLLKILFERKLPVPKHRPNLKKNLGLDVFLFHEE